MPSPATASVASMLDDFVARHVRNKTFFSKKPKMTRMTQSGPQARFGEHQRIAAPRLVPVPPPPFSDSAPACRPLQPLRRQP
jgi:hypothetical protein